MPYLDNAYCPACGQAMLFVFSPNSAKTCQIVCDNSALCPRPSAAAEILSDPEVHHIAQISEGDDGGTDYTIKHPLLERLDGELFDCPVLKALFSSGAPCDEQGYELLPGKYRVTLGDDGWQWILLKGSW